MKTLHNMWLIVVNLFQSPLMLSLAGVGILLGALYIAFTEGREYGKDR